MEKMTITRALVEKKRLEERIERALREFRPTVILVGNSIPAGFQSVEAFKEHVKGKYDSLKDMIDRRCKIVQKIAQSNATTKVTVNGQEMTVAEALEKKNFYKATGKNVLTTFQTVYASSKNKFEQVEANEKSKADQEFEKLIGRDKSVKEEEMRAVRETIDKNHKVTLVDPIEIGKVYEEMSEKNTKFLEDVDIALTESNSKTEIEI